MKSTVLPIHCHTNSESVTLKNKKVFIFSAIGDPASFRASINNLGAVICGMKEFEDHYSYSQQDLETIDIQVKKTNAEYLVTTEKDWVKVQNFTSGYPIFVLGAHIRFSKEKELKQLLQPFIS
jgi:tetraacyldisaccharide 4'-kinase